MNGKIVLMMDGKYIDAHTDETLLTTAQRHGIFIPTLCFLEGLTGVGACRMCLVEVKGLSRLQPACLTMAAQGMEVITNSPKLVKYRQMILELVFSERNHVCAVCVSNGHCELQELAQQLGLTHLRLPYRYPRMLVDSSHERFRKDDNRCILCGRCVRVCDEIEGAHTWDIVERGIESRVVTDLAQPWGESESCTGCSKCVHVCPTGALSQKGTSVAEMKKRRQFLPYLTAMREKWHE
ncbi:MAG: bidirectional hydrogenase complex protein HoxU [Phycisphaerae bacterium]